MGCACATANPRSPNASDNERRCWRYPIVEYGTHRSHISNCRLLPQLAFGRPAIRSDQPNIPTNQSPVGISNPIPCESRVNLHGSHPIQSATRERRKICASIGPEPVPGWAGRFRPRHEAAETEGPRHAHSAHTGNSGVRKFAHTRLQVGIWPCSKELRRPSTSRPESSPFSIHSRIIFRWSSGPRHENR